MDGWQTFKDWAPLWSTLLLTLITAVYAWLTFMMLKETRRASNAATISAEASRVAAEQAASALEATRESNGYQLLSAPINVRYNVAVAPGRGLFEPSAIIAYMITADRQIYIHDIGWIAHSVRPSWRLWMLYLLTRPRSRDQGPPMADSEEPSEGEMASLTSLFTSTFPIETVTGAELWLQLRNPEILAPLTQLSDSALMIRYSTLPGGAQTSVLLHAEQVATHVNERAARSRKLGKRRNPSVGMQVLAE